MTNLARATSELDLQHLQSVHETHILSQKLKRFIDYDY